MRGIIGKKSEQIVRDDRGIGELLGIFLGDGRLRDKRKNSTEKRRGSPNNSGCFKIEAKC